PIAPRWPDPLAAAPRRRACHRPPVRLQSGPDDSGSRSAGARGMSYLLIIIVRAVVGFIAGQYLKGSEHGSGIDALAGGIGGCHFVLLSRVVGPAAAAGWFMSTIIAA